MKAIQQSPTSVVFTAIYDHEKDAFRTTGTQERQTKQDNRNIVADKGRPAGVLRIEIH